MRHARIRHGQDALAREAQAVDELILNRIARAARARARRITALNHEAIDDAVEDNAVIESLLCQVDEVLRRDWRLILKKLDFKISLVRLKYCNAICHLFLSSIG